MSANQKMDAGTLWEELVESSRQRANTPGSERRLACRGLRLRPAQAQWLPNKPREISQIDASLRSLFRRLILGELPWPVYLHGETGVGKTCAALCLVDAAGGIYLTVEELCEKLISAEHGSLVNPWSGKPMTKIGFWESLYTTQLLVLDELGARRMVSDFHFENVKRVLDQRENRPLVCISNLDLARLSEVYDDRLASRLGAGTVVELAGADRRLSPNPSIGQ